MVWAKVDDGMWKHRKFMLLSMQARGLWVTALSYAGMECTDHIPESFVVMACAAVRAPDGDLAAELVDAGLWDKDPDGDGYRIHDWDDYQTAAAADSKSAAGRIGGLTRSLKQAQERIAELEGRQNSELPSTFQAPSKQPASTQQAPVSDRPSTDPEPEPEPETRTPETHADDVGAPSDRFEEFWDRYPRHATSGKPGGGGSKAKTRKLWDKLDDDAQADVLTGVAHYAEFIGRDDSPFPCHATTWLNESRWEGWQEPAEPAERSPPSPRDISEFDGETREF